MRGGRMARVFSLGGLLLVCGVAVLAKDKLQIITFGPIQWRRGATTEVTIQGKGLETIQALELTPPDGVTLGEPKPAEAGKKKEQRWTSRVQVDAAAAPGSRTLVVVTPAGRSGPSTVFIPSHVPELSELRGELAMSSPLTVGFSVVVHDEEADLAEMPYTIAQVICKNGGRSMEGDGIVTQRRDAKTVVVRYAVMSNSRVSGGGCVLQVRVVDKKGNSSEWATTPVTFP